MRAKLDDFGYELMVFSKFQSFFLGSYDNDVALIEIDPIDLNTDSTINPVCLPTTSDLFENVNSIVTGWGTLTSGMSWNWVSLDYFELQNKLIFNFLLSLIRREPTQHSARGIHSHYLECFV